MPDPVILALDTALARCSVAILRGEHVLAHLSEAMARGHAERLAPMVQEALALAGIEPQGIERIAVTTGPGSFTGLRVGLAFARGLSLALARPCLGFSTLEALALGQGSDGRRAAALPAPEGVYFALYENGAALQPPARLAVEEVERLLAHAPTRLYGPAALRFAGFAQAHPLEAPDAAALARLAMAADAAAHPPRPLYLREAYARPVT